MCIRDRSFHWIAAEDEYTQVCGFLTIARPLMKKGDMNERVETEFLDQAISAFLSGSYHVRNAALTAIRRFMQHGEENAFHSSTKSPIVVSNFPKQSNASIC